MDSRTPLARFSVIGLCAMFLGGCATLSTRPSMVVFAKDGRQTEISTNEYLTLRPAVATLLAEQNLRLVDNPRAARVLTLVTIEKSPTGGQPTLSIARVSPYAAWQSARQSAVDISDSRFSRQPELPSQSTGLHPSLQLAETMHRMAQNQDGR